MNTSSLRLWVGVIALTLGVSSISWGQTSSTPIDELEKTSGAGESRASLKDQKAPPSEESVERIQVTGSHIKRIDIEGPSPVQILDRSDLDRSGYNSVADVLRDTTANSFGSLREASGSNASNVAHVNLRGLGSSSTLVLLNGQRLPSNAVTGSVDLNLIPMAAVERIEVLKDGASALYGSDALGGVVNIITRKDFSGTEASIQQSMTTLPGGKKMEVSVVNGINKGRLNMVNVVHFRENEQVFSRDREFTNKGVSTIGSPGGWQGADGKWIADPSCPAGQVESRPNGDFCKYKYSDHSTELPYLQQVSVMSESNIKLGSGAKLKVRGGGTQSTSKWAYAPAPGVFTIDKDAAQKLGPGGTPLPGADPNKDLIARYRLEELGKRESETETLAANLLIAGVIEHGDTWETEVSAGYNHVQSKDVGVSGYALTPVLNELIRTGEFNPFAPPGQRGSLNTAKYQPTEKTLSELSSADLKASGEVGEISSGPVGLALGFSYTHQKYEDKFDVQSVEGNVFGNAGSSGGGQRYTQAVYTELSIPLHRKLEWQIAGRYDNYSDFGDTFNPKTALRYQVIPQLLFRTSVGTGFKAPLMQDLYAASSLGYPIFIDHVACEQEKKAGGPTPSCDPQQYEVTSGGNVGLKEEKSISYSAGVIFQPNRNFNIGMDLWLTKLSNVVGIDYEDAMLAESKGIDLAKSGVIVNRDTNGYIQSIEAPLQNLSSQDVQGVDMSMDARMGKFKLGVEYSYLLYFKEEGFPGAGKRDKLGENGRPGWRNSVSLGFVPSERQDISLIATTISGHNKAVKEEGRLPAYTSLDMQYNFKMRKMGVITLGAKNILGKTPPIDDTNISRPLDTTLYDQIGTQIYTAYRAGF